MNQYILLVHDAGEDKSTAEEWETFFDAASVTGMFRGGSAIGESAVIGDTKVAKLSGKVAGYMRFDSDDKDTLLDLLKRHPVVVHGGTVELCELPES